MTTARLRSPVNVTPGTVVRARVRTAPARPVGTWTCWAIAMPGADWEARNDQAGRRPTTERSQRAHGDGGGDALVGDPRTERQRDHQAYAREGSARPPAGRDRALPPGAPNHRSEGPTGQPYRAAEDLSQEVRVAFGGRYIELALLLENASGAKQRAPRSDRTSTKIHLLTSLACGCLASDPVIRRRRSKHTTFRLRRTL